MKKILCSILLASTTILAIAQLNMTLTDQINYPQGTSSLWGYIDPEDGTEYAAVGTRTGRNSGANPVGMSEKFGKFYF